MLSANSALPRCVLLLPPIGISNSSVVHLGLCTGNSIRGSFYPHNAVLSVYDHSPSLRAFKASIWWSLIVVVLNRSFIWAQPSLYLSNNSKLLIGQIYAVAMRRNSCICERMLLWNLDFGSR